MTEGFAESLPFLTIPPFTQAVSHVGRCQVSTNPLRNDHQYRPLRSRTRVARSTIHLSICYCASILISLHLFISVVHTSKFPTVSPRPVAAQVNKSLWTSWCSINDYSVLYSFRNGALTSYRLGLHCFMFSHMTCTNSRSTSFWSRTFKETAVSHF